MIQDGEKVDIERFFIPQRPVIIKSGDAVHWRDKGLAIWIGDCFDKIHDFRFAGRINTPAKDFWSVIVYSIETKSFIRNAKRVGLSSRYADTMKVNDDGSYDIYFSPKPPKEKESNWIPTTEYYFFAVPPLRSSK